MAKRRSLNEVIDWLPFEMNVPGMNFCGPGTDVEKRLANGDHGINPVDEACKSHDIPYHKTKNPELRAEADRELTKNIMRYINKNDISGFKKFVYLNLATIMNMKTPLISEDEDNDESFTESMFGLLAYIIPPLLYAKEMKKNGKTVFNVGIKS